MVNSRQLSSAAFLNSECFHSNRMVSLATESMKKSNFLHQLETSTRYTFSLFLKGRCLEIIDPFLFDYKNSTAKVLYFANIFAILECPRSQRLCGHCYGVVIKYTDTVFGYLLTTLTGFRRSHQILGHGFGVVIKYTDMVST